MTGASFLRQGVSKLISYHFAECWFSESSQLGGCGRSSFSFGRSRLLCSQISTGTPSKVRPPQTRSGSPSGRTRAFSLVTTSHSTMPMAHRYAIFLCSLDVEIQHMVATLYMGGRLLWALLQQCLKLPPIFFNKKFILYG